MVAVVIGEGGSGGAIAIATANRVLMLEHSIYTVASPEAAASILWRDSARAIDAATNMKITAQDLKTLGVIDVIIPEPVGGAHRDPDARRSGAPAMPSPRRLREFDGMSRRRIRRQRHDQFLEIGADRSERRRQPRDRRIRRRTRPWPISLVTHRPLLGRRTG